MSPSGSFSIPLTLDAIREASARIAPFLHRTPLVRSVNGNTS